MTEAEWLSLTDPTVMLDWARAAIRGNTTPSVLPDGYRAMPDRKLRLFDDACFVMFKLNIDDMAVQASPPPEAASLLRCIFGNPFRPPVFPKTAGCHWCAISDASHVHVPDAWLAWNDGIVVKLAQAAYEEPAERKCWRCLGTGTISFYDNPCPICNATGRISDGTLDAGRLAVIADALEEAGCSNEEEKCPMCRGKPRGIHSPKGGWITCPLCWGHLRIGNLLLAHLRLPGPHFRGCWALDLLLGKE